LLLKSVSAITMKLASSSPSMAGASFGGIMLLLLMQLSIAASSSQLRGPAKTHGSLLSTKDAKLTADENAEDGVESAEATIEEAEKLAASQEVTENTGTADTGTDANIEETTKPKPASSSKPKVLAGKTRNGHQGLEVTIVSARGLKNQDTKKRGMTDPFCICEVKGKRNAKVQTVPLDGTNGVHWDHVGTINSFTMHDVLTCSVYDKDALPTDSDRFLGKTTLKGVKVLPGGFNGELPLGSAGPEMAYLKLKIAPMAMVDSNSDAKSSMEDTETEEAEQESGEDGKDSSSEDDKDDSSEGDDSESNEQDD